MGADGARRVRQEPAPAVHCPPVALRGYFDGSGAYGPQYQAITLAGLSASEKVWPDFERAWGLALDSIGFRLWRTSALRQHMTDAAFYRAADTLIGVIAELGKRR